MTKNKRLSKLRSNKPPTRNNSMPAMLQRETATLETSFVQVVDMIRTARQKAYQTVNTLLINLYWQVGEYLSRQAQESNWGKSVILNLSEFIQKREPGIRGFSAQNLWRMKQFYETYRGQKKLSALLREIGWTHNILILGKCKTPEEKEFYIHLAIRDKLSSRDLEKKIDSAFFERNLLSPPKMSSAAKQLYPVASQVFKDSYLVDFLDLPEFHSEHDLRRGLSANIRRFLSELGTDFCFVGEEFRLQVGGKDFFIDLLFYHRSLSCLVAFELKIDDFKPAYLGQLSFYLEALDRDVRKPHEQPSVGVLLCKSRDSEVVEYALSRTLSPALVAEYQIRLPDKKILQQKLHEFYELQKNDKG